MWATVNVMGVEGRCAHLSLPATDPMATSSPLAHLGKEAGGNTFLGQEGKITVHLPIYYIPLHSVLLCPLSSGPVPQRPSAPLTRCLALCLVWMGGSLEKGLNPKSSSKVHDSQEAAGGVCSKQGLLSS